MNSKDENLDKYIFGDIGDHNYCRSPYPDRYGVPAGAWCYTTDPGSRWEYCGCGEAHDGDCYRLKDTTGYHYMPIDKGTSPLMTVQFCKDLCTGQ